MILRLDRSSAGSRILARMGDRYPDLLVAVFIAFVVCLTVLHAAQVAPFLDAGFDVLSVVIPIGLAGQVAAMLVWVPVIRRALRPVRVFLRSESSPDAAKAWDAIVRGLPRALVITLCWILVFAVPPALYALIVLLELNWATMMASSVVLGTLIISGVLIGFLGWEAALAPVVRRIDAVRRDRHTRAPGWTTMRFKLLAIPSVSVVYGALLAGGLVGTVSGELATILVALGSAIAVSLTVSLAMTLLLRRSFVVPTGELVAATARVAEGRFTEPVPQLGADELGHLSRSFNSMMEGLRERAAMHEALKAYVHPEVVGRLVSEGTVLDGAEVEATVVFLDVRGFTAYSEKAEPGEAVRRLNRLFGVAVPIIEDCGGHANKFLGDGVLAAFGAPTPLPDHAERALGACCHVIDAVEREFRGELKLGIGLNSGRVMMGTLGGGGHLEFTLIGDTVNVAARVEQLTKDLGEEILLTEATRSRLGDPAPALASRGELRVRGKTEPVKVYAVERWRETAAMDGGVAAP